MHLGVSDPPGPPLSRILRAVVLEHAANEHRRVFDPTLHLAALTQEGDRTPIHCVLGREDTWDDALLTDVTAALLRRLPPQRATGRWLAWLTRTGDLDIQDLDLASLRALRRAAAEAEAADFHFVVVNRRAWRDPVTGVGREWKRLRDRR